MSEIIAMADDGFGVQEKSNSTMIVGKLLKFTDGRYIADKAETLPADMTLVAINVVTAWVHWADGKPVEHRITGPGQLHPEREDLPDQDESQWPPGLNGEPNDPWRDTRYLHLIDPQTGADFTFVTDSYGGRRGVSDLKSQIFNVRYTHPAAVPVVQLGSAPMKTKFGLKQRPAFKVVGWRGKQERTPLQVLHKQEERCEPQKPFTDEIPF